MPLARSESGSRTCSSSRSATIAGGERPMLGFETLTFAPIDLSLVEPKLMDADEIAWLDDYHARVRKTLSPRVDSLTRALAYEGHPPPCRGQGAAG